MGKPFADLIAEATATAGTGSVTMTALTGWARFNDRFVASDRVYYAIQNGSNREVGLGTYSGGHVLARTTIIGTLAAGVWTTGGSALTLAGNSIVRCVAPEQLLKQFLKEEISFISGPTTLADGFAYGVQASSLTLTLPAAPTVGDRIRVFQAAASITGTIIDPNGSKINNTVGTMTVDVDEFSLSLLYVSAGYGWKVLP